MKKEKNQNLTLEEKNSKFNSNESGLRNRGVFGLPFSERESKIVLVPVPWEATVSYGSGAALGPKAILNASRQIDLYDSSFPNFWKMGIAFSNNSQDIFSKSTKTFKKTRRYLQKYTKGVIDHKLQKEIKSPLLSIQKGAILQNINLQRF